MQKVALQLKINGEDKTALIADRLASLTVTDQADLDSDTLSLTLNDRAPHIKLPPIKATLQLWLNQTYMGACRPGGRSPEHGFNEAEAFTPRICPHAANAAKLRALASMRPRLLHLGYDHAVIDHGGVI